MRNEIPHLLEILSSSGGNGGFDGGGGDNDDNPSSDDDSTNGSRRRLPTQRAGVEDGSKMHTLIYTVEGRN